MVALHQCNPPDQSFSRLLFLPLFNGSDLRTTYIYLGEKLALAVRANSSFSKPNGIFNGLSDLLNYPVEIGHALDWRKKMIKHLKSSKGRVNKAGGETMRTEIEVLWENGGGGSEKNMVEVDGSSQYSGSLINHPEEIISVYRGWDNFERKKKELKCPIIDFDLAPACQAVTFSSRKEVLRKLESLATRLDDASSEGEFLRDKLIGSIFYLRALMGEKIPFDEYIRNTLGVPPRSFSDKEIQESKYKVNESLSHFGLQLEEKYKEAYEKKLLINDLTQIKAEILEEKDFWLHRLRKKGIPHTEKIDFRVVQVEEDAYWSNWISGSLTKGFTLSVNLHSRKKYDKGKPLFLCLHEICGHVVQMSIWRERIIKGDLNPACGITTVHSPEMFVSEGLGQTVAEFVGEEKDFSPELRLSRDLHFYSLMVLHNAHLMIYKNIPVEKILTYAQEHLPFTNIKIIEAEIRDRKSSPLYRTYLLSYSSAQHMISGILQGFSRQQKDRFFQKIYTDPMTPSQLLKFANQLKSSHTLK